MSQIERINDQLRRAFESEAWCGSSLREALAGVTARRALAKPLADAHCIWEIVLHVAVWKRTVRRRLEGERITVPEEGDFPHIMDTSEDAWQDALRILENAHKELKDSVICMPDSRLEEPVAEGMSSAYVTLHGSVQHDHYHAAQIMLLKKM
jgi:uncharacterized damage-inducible protein DinB